MKISIIITLFNRKKLISRALDSCLALNLPKDNYEIIIIDDGSTDNPLSLLSSYIEHSFIRYYFQNNQGAAAAKNAGAQHANGEYIIFLDSDDYFYDKDCFTELLPLLDEKPDLVYSEKIILLKKYGIEEITTPLGDENIFEYLLRYPLNYPGKPSYIFNKSKFLTINGFNIEHKWGDALLFWRVYLTETSKTLKLKKINYVYDQSSDEGVSRSRDKNYYSRVFKTIYDTYLVLYVKLKEKKYTQNWAIVLLYLAFRSKEYIIFLKLGLYLLKSPVLTSKSLIFLYKKRKNRG
ncbi:glycosyltransferase family 2 protein [Providencia rettgeri]